jgi:2-phosphoglycerate kinase
MAAAITTAPALAPAPVSPAPSATSIPTPQQQELESRARSFVAQERFNRRFTLPATDAHDELTVTYAVGGVDTDTAPTVLFIGGMYGGRLLATTSDHVARRLGLRVVVVDR